MNGFVEDILDAEDQIFSLFHDVLANSVPAVVARIPEVFWHGVTSEADPKSPPADDIWIRVTISNELAEQASLSGADAKCAWDRKGVLTIQFFSPIKDPSGLRICKRLAILAQRAYEKGGSASAVTFRDVRIDPVGPSESWFQTNLTAKFEYSEFH